MAGPYYVWRVTGKPVEVLFCLAAVERLRATILHGRPTGCWGLLLGHSGRRSGVRVTVVDDFEPLPVMPKHGRLRPPEGSRSKVVGAYRAAPGETFRLDEADAATVGGTFDDPGMVYLLVRPETGHAAFFVQEDGVMHGYASYLLFPFNSRHLRDLGPLLEPKPRSSRRSLATAAVVAAAAISAGAWFGRPVAPPPIPQAPAAPSLTEPEPARPSRSPARRVTRGQAKTSLLPAVPTARADLGPTQRPSRFRRLISHFPGLGISSK